MPLYMNHVSKLRKSEKTTATDLLFTIGNKQFKKLNLHNTENNFKFELIDYPEFYKIKIIKYIKNTSKRNITDIQQMFEHLPIIISKQLSLQEAKALESKLIRLGCKIRIS